MATDPMWCFEQYGEAAEYIDELEARVGVLESALEQLAGQLSHVKNDTLLPSLKQARAALRK
jgi:hypothetical protein